jgi:PAS domain-containing protein
LLGVVILFAGFAYGRRKRVAELKTLVRSVEERAAPSAQQIDQLSQAIIRSQKSFKELIDSLDDAAFAISLDGTFRTVNKRVTQFLGATYQEIVGHKLHDFLEEPTIEHSALPGAFWNAGAGQILKLCLKNNPRTLYFDCEINAIVNDDSSRGVLARDVTDEREKKN